MEFVHITKTVERRNSILSPDMKYGISEEPAARQKYSQVKFFKKPPRKDDRDHGGATRNRRRAGGDRDRCDAYDQENQLILNADMRMETDKIGVFSLP